MRAACGVACRARQGAAAAAHRAIVHEALVPHGDVAGEAAEGLAQRGDEPRLVPVLAARCGVASHPVMADALPRGSHVDVEVTWVAERRTSPPPQGVITRVRAASSAIPRS